MNLTRSPRHRPNPLAQTGPSTLERMARPVGKWFWHSGLTSLRQRIRPRSDAPDQDGDPCSPVLIITAASGAIQCSRFPCCRLTVRPSCFHHPQTSATARRQSPPVGQYLFTRRPHARPRSQCRVPALPGRCGAVCWRAPPPRYSCGRAPAAPLPTCRVAYRARQGGAVRRAPHGSGSCAGIDCPARLLMPSSLGLPPVVFCRGTNQSRAAMPRPRAKACPWPTAATSAVPLIAPIPGTVASLRAAPSVRAWDTNLASKAAIRSSSACHSSRRSPISCRMRERSLDASSARMSGNIVSSLRRPYGAVMPRSNRIDRS